MLFPTLVCAQINTDRVMTIARNALYFEDYVLSIQYFNQVINAKPYLYEPYFFRALAKLNLEDFQGAEADCDAAIQRNPFVVWRESGRVNLTVLLKTIRKRCIMIRRTLLCGII